MMKRNLIAKVKRLNALQRRGFRSILSLAD